MLLWRDAGARGAAVTLIARPLHVDAIAREGLRLESIHFDERIPLAATTDVAAVRDADIVLISVKTPDTESAAQTLSPHLSADALLVSLQNGVDNAQRIRAHVFQQVVAAVVSVAAEMTSPGHVKHTGRGDLIVGRQDGQPADDAGRIDALAAMLSRADVGEPDGSRVGEAVGTTMRIGRSKESADCPVISQFANRIIRLLNH